MRKIVSLFLLSFVIFQFTYAQDDTVKPEEWDFGKVKQDQVLKHDFVFKNETKGILKITGVNTSCGCTASSADKQSLNPGESTKINVAFNSKKYLGEVKQHIYVNTDNADSPITKFVIKAEVLKGE